MELIHLHMVTRHYLEAVEYQEEQSVIPHERILALDHPLNNITQVDYI